MRGRAPKLVSQNVALVFAFGPEIGIIVDTESNGMFPGEHADDQSGMTPPPYRFLGGELAGKIERFFKTPGWNKS